MSLPVVAEHGFIIADEREVRAELNARLPAIKEAAVSPRRGPRRDPTAALAHSAPIGVCAFLTLWIALSAANAEPLACRCSSTRRRT